jgi:hypothetical protein
VLDDPSDPGAFNRRQLEVVAILELAAAIQAGEMFVAGSLSYDRFWDRLPPETADPAAMAAYAASQGWGEGAEGFIRTLKDSLDREMRFLEHAVGHARDSYIRCIRCDKDGRPIVTRPPRRRSRLPRWIWKSAFLTACRSAVSSRRLRTPSTGRSGRGTSGPPSDWPHRSRMPIAAMYLRPSHTAVGWDRRKRHGT